MSGEEWTPSRPFWRNGAAGRLGPQRAEPVLRAFSPTVDRLPGDARSVFVPAVLAIGAIVLGVIAFGLSGAAVTSAVARSNALEDIDNIGSSHTSTQIEECRERRQELDRARQRYVQSTGDEPDHIDDLDVGATDFVVGADGRPVPAPGSTCEGVVGRDASTPDAVADRIDVALATIAHEVDFLFYTAAVLILFAAPGLLSWWLAEAYRCLPKAVRHRSPRRAYTLIKTTAVATPLAFAAQIAIGVYVSADDVILAEVLNLVVWIAYIVVVVRAMLRVADMIGQVTFEFCDRHYGTARALRACALAFCLLPLVANLLFFSAVGTRDVDVVPTILMVGVVLCLAAWWIVVPIVFLVCLFVAISIGTAGIDRTLAAAAHEINVAEAEGRSLPSTEYSALV